MTDSELLRRLADDDHEAFNEAFRAHYAPLVGFAESLLRDRALAEETAQEAMMELWKRRASLERLESLRAYLFRSVRNRSLNHLRQQRAHREAEPRVLEGLEPPPPASLRLVEGEIDEALREAVAGLPPRCREVFELSRVHGLRYAEIAETLGIGVKAVEAQMGRALRELRVRLAEWLPGGDDG